MGFKRQTTVYDLHFEDPRFEGLEVQAKSLPTGKLMKLMRLSTQIGGKGVDDLASVDELFGGFAAALVSWNLEEEDGTPIPATLDAINDQDFDFVMAVIMAWMEAVAGVPSDLGKDSTSGDPSLEASLPMAPV